MYLSSSWVAISKIPNNRFEKNWSLQSLKIFWSMKHLKLNVIKCDTFWCIKKNMIILKMCSSVTNKK